jgi:dTDP-4-dehydrorhamnose 3,5-epimerase
MRFTQTPLTGTSVIELDRLGDERGWFARTFDVAVDVRPQSPTYRRWHGVEPSSENARALYSPAGLAHGFQTLTDDCEVLYQMGHAYVPEAARGVRWDDPALAIEWPEPRGERTISERDRGYPDLDP